MGTKEFRIGNVVTLGSHNADYLIVEGLTSDMVRIPDKEKSWVWVDKSMIYGIPLIPEILEKCGFKITKINGCVFALEMPDYDATLQLWGGNEYMSICRSGIAAYHSDCKYLHQLQNLYFALTGEELMFKF